MKRENRRDGQTSQLHLLFRKLSEGRDQEEKQREKSKAKKPDLLEKNAAYPLSTPP